MDRKAASPETVPSGGAPARAPSNVLLLVATGEMVGVPYAEVIVWRNGVEKAHAADSNGLLMLPSAEAAGALIAATAPGLGRASISIPQVPGEEYLIQLDASVSVGGWLEMKDGAPIPSGVRVVAWVEGAEAGFGADAARLVEHRLALVADVEPGGRFAISGLCQGRAYGVSAFGGGVFIPVEEEIRQILGPAEGLVLSAGYIGAALLDVESTSGAAEDFLRHVARGFKHQVNSTEVWFEWNLPPQCSPLSPRHWSVRLAGYPKQHAAGAVFPRMVVVGSPARDLLGIEATCNVRIGHVIDESIRFSIDYVAAPGAVRTYTLPLSFSDWRFGRLFLKMRTHLTLPATEEHPAPHRAILRPVGDPSARSLDLIALRVGDDAVLDVGQVPTGTYECWLYVSSFNLQVPGQAHAGVVVEVKEGQAVTAEMPTDHLSRVRIDLLDARGFPYTGFLNAELYRQSPSGGYVSAARTSGLFRSSPLTWDLVPPGEHFLRLYGKAVLGHGHSFIPLITKPGEETVLELILED